MTNLGDFVEVAFVRNVNETSWEAVSVWILQVSDVGRPHIYGEDMVWCKGQPLGHSLSPVVRLDTSENLSWRDRTL